MNRADGPSPHLSNAVETGLAAPIAHTVFDAADPDGSTLSIVEITDDLCTVLVREAGPPKRAPRFSPSTNWPLWRTLLNDAPLRPLNEGFDAASTTVKGLKRTRITKGWNISRVLAVCWRSGRIPSVRYWSTLAG
jgi:hypothetical protein